MVANWGPRNGISLPADAAHGTNCANGANGNASVTQTIVAPPLEKRKSSYEKYSAFIMPPLAEERTPVASPAGTLKSEAAPPPEAFVEEEEEWEPPVVETKVATEESRDEIAVEVPPAEPAVDVKPVEVQHELLNEVIELG
uniref:Mixed-linked glucanase n=1 Tax=Ganoderma boninense TaxID=34458 RepID=A0A5K1JX67_9APHY|nr:Mixed-linked glucanase [Ganoderma boninense]